MTDIFDIAGKVAIVTGASSGLGAHFAPMLAARGARVVAIARREDRLAGVVAAIRDAGGTVLGLPADVSDDAAMERCLAAVEAEFGTPDILVNNAGISVVRDALSVTRDDWNRVIGTNLTAAWALAQRVARMMAAAGKTGSIINITSVAGSRRVLANASPYVAAKAGLTGLTKVLAVELAPRGIRVNAIAPGLFETELAGGDPATTRERRGRMTAKIPMGRVGEFAELDGTLLLLASDASSYMTGAVLVVDGGYSEGSL